MLGTCAVLAGRHQRASKKCRLVVKDSNEPGPRVFSGAKRDQRSPSNK